MGLHSARMVEVRGNLGSTDEVPVKALKDRILRRRDAEVLKVRQAVRPYIVALDDTTYPIVVCSILHDDVAESGNTLDVLEGVADEACGSAPQPKRSISVLDVDLWLIEFEREIGPAW